MKTVLEQYNSAIRITKVSPRQARLFASAPSVISNDTETTGLIFNQPSWLHREDGDILMSNPYPFGLSLAFRYRERVVLAWADIRVQPKLYYDIADLFGNSITKTWYGARYDLRVCKENRIKVRGEQNCTLTASRIYWDRRKKHSLQRLSEFLWPELSAWEVDLKKEWTKLQTRYTKAGHEPGYTNYSFLPDSLVGPYSMTDSFVGLMLFDKLYPIMIRDFPELYERELRVMHVISKVECRGLAFNSKRAKRKASHLRKQMKISLDKMADVAGLDFNPNSPAQVLKTLRQLGVKDKQLTEKGKVTTGADKLREVLAGTKRKRVSGFIEELLLHRAYAKTVGTYLEPLALRAEINNGIVYTSINPADTRTGRMASREPNLQNIPTLNPRRGRTSGGENPVRSGFICRDGFTNYYFDYSQMEIAVFGLLANEPLILDTYVAGGDIHGVMAETLYGKNYTKQERDRTKDTNYGIIYGMGIQGMAKYRAVSLPEAKEFLRFYHRQFPSVSSFLDECKWELKQKDYVEDWFGKRYHVPLNQAYKAVNCLVQGGCASIFKIGLLAISKFLDSSWSSKTNLLLPVHDEFIIESNVSRRGKREEKAFCKLTINRMTNISVLLDQELTLRVDVSKSQTNWAEKEKLEI